MKQEELIIIVLAVALLGICYFSPLKNSSNTKEDFKNSDACAGMTRDTYTNNGYNKDGIQLVKSDGVTVGGYRPQIVRPFDSVSDQIDGDYCNGPCYTGRKYQTWCNEEDAINYYAMRPIISYETYLNNVKKMFELIKDPVKNVPNIIEPQYTTVFCTETQKSIMDWLMTKIAVAVSKMPEMQRNGPWKSERFYETDVKLFQFMKDSVNVYQVLFNLYNPLRSTSTEVLATVLVRKENGKQMPYLMDIRFVSEANMTDYQCSANGFGPINGHNIVSSVNDSYKAMNIVPFEPLGLPNSPEGMKEYAQNWKDDPNQFDWTYQNTLEVQKFNKYGFHSNNPKDNIKIEGGVPDSLKTALKNCAENQLSDCFTPAFTGFVGAVSAKSLNDAIGLKKIDGEPENVYAYPKLVYSLDRKIEKLVY